MCTLYTSDHYNILVKQHLVNSYTLRLITHMSHPHLHDVHSCGCNCHCVNTGEEMSQLQCSPHYPIGFLLILHQIQHYDVQMLLLGTQVAGI